MRVTNNLKSFKTKKVRDPYWDAVRGIAILAVIWIHTRTGESYQNSEFSWNFDYWVVIRQAINFPVGLFFFLSGFFINTNKISPVVPWLQQRFIRLVIPYFVWSLIYGALSLAVNWGSVNLSDWLFRVFMGATVAHLYFIVVLVQLTLLTPWLGKAVKSRWSIVLFLVSPLYLGIIYLISGMNGGLPWWYAHLFMPWLIFYFAGLWVKEHNGFRIRPVLGVLIAIGAFCISVWESYFLIGEGFPLQLAVSQLNITSVVFTLSLILVFLASSSKSEKNVFRPLITVGIQSYGIYYVHIFWLLILGRLIDQMPVFSDVPILAGIQFIQIGFALSMSLVSIKIVTRIFGKNIAGKYFGF